MDRIGRFRDPADRRYNQRKGARKNDWVLLLNFAVEWMPPIPKPNGLSRRKTLPREFMEIFA
jgi:hypothetical protein